MMQCCFKQKSSEKKIQLLDSARQQKRMQDTLIEPENVSKLKKEQKTSQVLVSKTLLTKDQNKNSQTFPQGETVVIDASSGELISEALIQKPSDLIQKPSELIQKPSDLSQKPSDLIQKPSDQTEKKQEDLPLFQPLRLVSMTLGSEHLGHFNNSSIRCLTPIANSPTSFSIIDSACRERVASYVTAKFQSTPKLSNQENNIDQECDEVQEDQSNSQEFNCLSIRSFNQYLSGSQ